MTTYGYARVSTDAQSIALQLDALGKAGVSPEATFTDEGVSGALPARERPAMAALLVHLRRGDTLVTYSLSRLGRNTLDVLTLVRDLEARGVSLRSLTEGFDTSTPMGRAMLGIMAVLAQLERETTLERVHAGIAAAKARGVKTGRPRSISPERRLAVLAALADGLSVAETARLVEVSDYSVRAIVRESAPNE
jgi:DNA invertase Pin-like site-specific DNA recombinase